MAGPHDRGLEARIAFMGDGDAISVCAAYLHHRGILAYGPDQIVVYDFDERICNAVTRFAEKEGLGNLSAVLYNCLDGAPMVAIASPTHQGCHGRQ